MPARSSTVQRGLSWTLLSQSGFRLSSIDPPSPSPFLFSLLSLSVKHGAASLVVCVSPNEGASGRAGVLHSSCIQ